MKFSFRAERWPTREPFRITGHEWSAFEVIVAEIERDGARGRGEAAGIYYLGETPDAMLDQLHAAMVRLGTAKLESNWLQAQLPPGGARNALDCALWDLRAKETGSSIWELCSIQPRVLETGMTIGIRDTPEAMAADADSARSFTRLKIKVDSDRPVERVRAVREMRPDVRLVVDANQGWTLAQLREFAPALQDLGVDVIEQPLPRGADGELKGYASPVSLCADESCVHLGELDEAAERYQMINIKLDKVGGLTAALALGQAARARGLSVMTGCMGGTSLAMAPAFVVGCISDIVDLDGPLLNKSDRLPPLSYHGGRVSGFDSTLWG